MTADQFCPASGRFCRHFSRALIIKPVCDIKTRKTERITWQGDPWCNNYSCAVSEIKTCPHHPQPRLGTCGITIIVGALPSKTRQQQIGEWGV